MNTRLTPSESFPENLAALELPEVEVLNSKIQRELSHEYVTAGEPDAETESRNEELTEELDRRDADEAGAPPPLLHSVESSAPTGPSSR
ncbi:hypothetical protein [Arthrobacter sp. MDT1-65]